VEKEQAKEREETSRAVGANLKAKVAQRTERRLAQDFEPVRGWNVPWTYNVL
jgi:hypothetical protein